MQKSMLKKVLSFLLALTMILGIFSIISINYHAETVKTNLALTATATADGQDSTEHAPSKAIDGIINRDADNKSQSRWGVEDKNSEGGNASDAEHKEHWLKIDLGSSKSFNELLIDWERKNIYNYVIEVSDNDTDYREIYSQTKQNGFSESIVLDEAVTARYVRVTVKDYTNKGPSLDGNGQEQAGDWASVSIYELQILQYTENENLATGKTATADGFEAGTDFKAQLAVDGDDSTRWASEQTDAPHWIMIDMGSACEVAAATIHWERNTVKSFEIQYSDTGLDNSWTAAYSYSSSDLYNGWNTKVNFEKPVTARYFRIYIKDFSDTGLTESDPEGSAKPWNTISIYEIGLYAKPLDLKEYTLDEVVSSLRIPEIKAEDKTLPMPEVPDGFDISLEGTNYDNIVEPDGTLHHPLSDKEIKVAFKVSKGEETKTTGDITITVPGTKEIPENANEKPVVIPELQEWAGAAGGSFAVSETTKVVISDESLRGTAEKLTEDMAEILNCTEPQIIVGSKEDAVKGDFYFELDSEDSMGLLEEGYYINIDDAMYVTAKTSTGAYWATRSVLQVFKQCVSDGTEVTIAKGEIRDYPKYEVRGFMLDVGRLPIELNTIYDIAETMSWYKLNDFELHLNDNGFLKEHAAEGVDPFDVYAAFRLESDIQNGNGESLTASDLYYTKEEFKKLILDGRELGVNIVPEFDFPAHSLAVTKIFPEYAYIGSNGDKMLVDHIDISKPEAVDLVKKIWDEYTDGQNPVFDDETIVNIGGDEYEVNPEVYRQFVDNMLQYVQGKGNTVRVWGSLTKLSGATDVYSDNVQMYLWNTTWANPKQMIDEGFDIININDFEVYMVPGASYYQDYLNAGKIYSSWKPNVINGITIPETEDQMIGGSYAIWNDCIGVLDNGIYDYDVFDRFYSCAASFSEKLWGEGTEKTYDELTEAYDKTSTAPGTNPFKEVETMSDDNLYAEYTFDHRDGRDISGNGYSANEEKNVSYVVNGENGYSVELEGGESYLSTPIDYFPVNTELTVKIMRTSESTEEQILFETDNELGVYSIKAVQKETGKVGFSRGTRDYSFDYTLPVGEWVTLTFRGEKDFASLYVNGELVDKIGSVDRPKVPSEAVRATLTLPFSRIGSKTNAFVGKIDYIIVQGDKNIIAESDNENQLNGFEGPIELAFDNNTSTFWHSNYSPVQALPANITVRYEKGNMTADRLVYVPRQSGDNGHITEIEVWYMNPEQGVNEFEKIAEAEWTADSTTKTLEFGKTYTASQFKIVVKSGKNSFGSAAEFKFEGGQDSINTENLQKAKNSADLILEKIPNLNNNPYFAELYNKAEEKLSVVSGTQIEYDSIASELNIMIDIINNIGDVDQNGIVNVTDATYTQLYLADIYVNNADCKKDYGDVNLDGTLTIDDTVKIMKYCCKIEDFFDF